MRHLGIANRRFVRGPLRDWEITLDRLLLGFKSREKRAITERTTAPAAA
jgi:hypothetical protein